MTKLKKKNMTKLKKSNCDKSNSDSSDSNSKSDIFQYKQFDNLTPQ